MGEHPGVAWWLHQERSQVPPGWTIHPLPQESRTQDGHRSAPGSSQQGFGVGLGWSLEHSVTLGHLCFRSLRGPLLSRCFCSRGGGFWSLLQAEFGEQMGKKGEAVRKEQRPSLQSRLNDLHQAEGPWQENEVTSALNPSPED